MRIVCFAGSTEETAQKEITNEIHLLNQDKHQWLCGFAHKEEKMKLCPNCKTWQPNEYRFCPECCNELERNEVSSEDGNDGKFLPSPGTKEWAVYQMKRGENVFHYKAKTLIYSKPSHYVRRFRLDKHLDDMSLEIWLNGADTTGWEIYQPKGD